MNVVRVIPLDALCLSYFETSKQTLTSKRNLYKLSVEKNPGIDGENRLLAACTIGAARELFEETGIDLRASLDRLKPINIWNNSNDEGGEKNNGLLCELEQRVFFSVDISDADLRTTVSCLYKLNCSGFVLVH